MPADKIMYLALMLLLYPSFGFLSGMADAKGIIYPEVPEKVDSKQKYLFYMHGAWIEMKGLNHAHSQYGVYEYDRIIQNLSEKGFVVISEARRARVEMKQYADKIAEQILRLLKNSVPPGNITVIGHSKGGHMSLMVASIIKEAKMNFVVMAGCGKKGTGFRHGYERFLMKNSGQLHGRILSIYDSADHVAGSCQEAFDSAAGVESKEIELKTGQGHGLFFSPNPVWVDEVVKWSGL